MWILPILVILFEIIFILWAPWHVAALFLLAYTLRWLDRAEETGHLAWPAFRSAFIWRWITPVKERTGDQILQSSSKNIILVTPVPHHSTLIWGIGLSSISNDVYYTQPWWLFHIPLVRDFLVWSGAVAENEVNMLNVLQQQKSVCYPVIACDEQEQEALAQLPADWLFQMAIHEQINLIIVIVQGSHFHFATRIQSGVYRDVENLKRAVTDAIQRGCILSLGDKYIKAL